MKRFLQLWHRFDPKECIFDVVVPLKLTEKILIQSGHSGQKQSNTKELARLGIDRRKQQKLLNVDPNNRFVEHNFVWTGTFIQGEIGIVDPVLNGL